MWKLIIFALLAVACLVSLLLLLIHGGVWMVQTIRQAGTAAVVTRLKKLGLFTAGIALTCVLFVGFTQWTASTPAIRDGQGNAVPGSIAELRQVDLNGRKEWISIRGRNTQNPVLLFLAGGPGGTQMAAVRHDLTELEDHFVLVNWDQPGAGKSYGSIAREDLTPEVYVDDGSALVQYLCQSFGQQKIYLVGESWGSALGILMIDKHPEMYHAFIGTGQMVDFVQTEIIDYTLALELARRAGNDSLVTTLEENGSPPYYGNDVTWKSAAYLNYLSGLMARNPEITNGGFQTYRDLASSEYGVLDQINFLRGIVRTFNHVYPQLYPIDLREGFTHLRVPVYFFLGRHDINAPLSLAQEYFDLLDVPAKEIVWFEHSGHNPWINESDAFVRELLRVSEAHGTPAAPAEPTE